MGYFISHIIQNVLLRLWNDSWTFIGDSKRHATFSQRRFRDGKELIEGNFSESDLTYVDASAIEKIFFIEKIIKKKTINGKLHYLVKWEGYPSKMNSYVLAREVKHG